MRNSGGPSARLDPLRLASRQGLWALFAATLAASVAVYLAWPDGVGGVVFVAVSAAGLAALVIGPLVRRPSPRTAWRWMAVGGGLFLVAQALRVGVLPASGGPASPDLWSILGYLSIIRSLHLLLMHSTRGSARSAVLDATIVTAGASLGFFSTELGPQLRRGESIVTVLLSISYPVLDTAVMALTLHLVLRSSRRSPSMLLLLGSITSLLVGDLAYVVYWHVAPLATTPWITAIFMLSYALIGASALHPSVTSPTEPTPEAARQSSGRSTVMLLMLAVPAAAAVLSPTSGPVDSTIRAGLMFVSVLAVHARLRYTVNALHDAAHELELSQERALHQALHDSLTGLPNRPALHQALTERLATCAPDRGTALLSLDADHFKRVNDTWGHPVGEAVIHDLAQRLTSALRPGDQLFRTGGDEFAVLMADADAAASQATAQQLLATAAEPFALGNGHTITMSSSIGMALAPPGRRVDADSLIQDADIALYAAKDLCRATWAVFDDSLRDALRRRVTLAEELREAMATGDVVPFFQPIRTGSGFAELSGFEALARWVRTGDQVVGPAEFIPVAEDTGLIVDLGRLMLESSCEQLAAWRRSCGRDLHVSVNVSAAQIMRTDVPALVAEVLGATGLPADALWLEITESLFLEDRGAALDTLRRLSDLGTVICIDDFGTGYSSLSYLKDFPVDVVKVDRAFVKELATDATSRGLTRAIIDMVRALDLLGVVAEGVDQPDQATLLEQWGCTWGQGFLWSQPLPPTEVEQLLLAGPLASPLS